LPVEITSGELYRVEVAGVTGLQLTRMEYNHTDRCYYAVDGYPLRDGLRAAIGEHCKSSEGVLGSSRFVEVLVPLQLYARTTKASHHIALLSLSAKLIRLIRSPHRRAP
jgi:hypothetical protein